MTQKRAPWRPDRTSTPSTGAMELAVSLAKRINKEIMVTMYQNTTSGQPTNVNEVLVLKGISLNEGKWSPTNVQSGDKAELPDTDTRRPFSCKSIRPLAKEKSMLAANINVKRPHSVAVKQASRVVGPDMSNSVPRKAPWTPKKLPLKAGKPSPQSVKSILENNDPLYNALFVAGKGEPREKYDYLDPFPDDFLSFHGNMLQKMKHFKDNLYALKLIELQKVLNVTLEWESHANSRTKPGNEPEIVNQEKGGSKDLRKTKSFEVVSAEKKPRGSKSDDNVYKSKLQTSRTKLSPSGNMSTDVEREYNRPKSCVIGKQCWNADFSQNAQNEEEMKRVLTSTTNFDKPIQREIKVGCRPKEKDARNGISVARKIKAESDPAKTFRNSGMKKYLALQKSYWEAQVKQSRKLMSSYNAKTSGNGLKNCRKDSTVGTSAPVGSQKAIKKRNSTRLIPHNCETVSQMSLAASGTSCQINKPRRSKSASKGLYDVKDIASSFDAPCQNSMKKRTSSVTALSHSRNLQPGKSFHSQRRVSLTKPKRAKTALSRSTSRK